MSSRHGVTLMEVLVAIFIMGIGMLCMLVLFPLGVLRMAQAIQDDRCAQACRMANAIANFQQVRNDPFVLFDTTPNCPVGIVGATITSPGGGYAPPPAPPPAVFFSPSPTGDTTTGAAMVAPLGTPNAGQIIGVTITHYGSGYVAGVPVAVSIAPPPAGGAQATALPIIGDSFTHPGGKNLLPADPWGPSYPVLVDPLGYLAAQGLANQYWAAGVFGTSNTFARRTTSFAQFPSSGLALRWFSLLDDIPFANDSTPQFDTEPNPPNVPGSLTRDLRYSWAYLLKRPRTSDRSVVDMSVVVFNQNRPVLYSNFNEYLYQTPPGGGGGEVTFSPSLTEPSITIDVTATGNTVPPARPGDWLLDASYVPSQNNTYATVNGNFYRIVSVTQNSETSYTYVVHQPLRNMQGTLAPNAWQKVIFLEGVAEVFEKGPGRLP